MDHAANTVPVTIITGFLGSGKTTVLNHLLRLPSLADTVVIVNEFGAVGLDHLLIEQAIEDAVLLKNGCICCTVRGDIADTLDTLWQRREAGELPPFRRIAIETTGLADPAPVAHALLAEPGARYACRLDGIVTTVDALHGTLQLDRQPEARRQVAMADRILLTKTDLASAAQIAESEARIAALNAGAPRRLGRLDDHGPCGGWRFGRRQSLHLGMQSVVQQHCAGELARMRRIGRATLLPAGGCMKETTLPGRAPASMIQLGRLYGSTISTNRRLAGQLAHRSRAGAGTACTSSCMKTIPIFRC